MAEDIKNNVPEEEDSSIVTFTDENGEDVSFEYLDCIEYEGKEYLVLIGAEEDAVKKISLFSGRERSASLELTLDK